MSWASILLALVRAVGALATYLQERQLITAGEAVATAAAMKEQHDALVEANKAREAVRSDLARHPDKRLSDDGFRRD